MTAVINDVANDWNARFQQSGYTYTYPCYDWVQGIRLDQAGAGATSTCGHASSNPAACHYAGNPDDYPDRTDVFQAFACSADWTVYMSVQWVNNNLWQPHIDPQPLPAGVCSARHRRT